MAEKRKDKKGRILKTGETQRKDGIYQYRYKDYWGKYQYEYSSTLEELRKKEVKIQEERSLKLKLSGDEITVFDMAKRYVGLKRGIKYRTRVSYNTVINNLKSDPFGGTKIKDIKVSDVKQWVIKLHEEDGKSYGTIAGIRTVLKPAFQMMCDDDIIRKNPFMFKLNEVLANDSKRRMAIEPCILSKYLLFLQEDKVYSKYYDIFVILLGTGMRVSELCGITEKDVDLDNKRIKISKQLTKKLDGTYYVQTPKTESGDRYVPMTDVVFDAIGRVIKNRPRPKTEVIVDGNTGFLFLNSKCVPRVSLDIDSAFLRALKKFRKMNPDIVVPQITPHNLRHTFCTNLANKGIEIQNLSYLMGHNDSSVTLDVYTHSCYNEAEKSFRKILVLDSATKENKAV